MAKRVYQLILLNDEYNSFDYVIDTLIDVCGHNVYQAEQCAIIVHNVGEVVIMEGTRKELKPRLDILIQNGLNAVLNLKKDDEKI